MTAANVLFELGLDSLTHASRVAATNLNTNEIQPFAYNSNVQREIFQKVEDNLQQLLNVLENETFTIQQLCLNFLPLLRISLMSKSKIFLEAINEIFETNYHMTQIKILAHQYKSKNFILLALRVKRMILMYKFKIKTTNKTKSFNEDVLIRPLSSLHFNPINYLFSMTATSAGCGNGAAISSTKTIRELKLNELMKLLSDNYSQIIKQETLDIKRSSSLSSSSSSSSDQFNKKNYFLGPIAATAASTPITQVSMATSAAANTNTTNNTTNTLVANEYINVTTEHINNQAFLQALLFGELAFRQTCKYTNYFATFTNINKQKRN